MHLLTFREPVTLGSYHFEGEYLFDNANAAKLLGMETLVETASGRVPLTDIVTLRPWKETPFDPSLDWNGEKLLIVRNGGFGDLLFLTPVIVELKRRWPTLEISVAALPEQAQSLQGNPDIARFVGIPIPFRDLISFSPHPDGNGGSAVVCIENGPDFHPDGHKKHICDLLAGEFNIELRDRTPRYFLRGEEMEWAERRFPKGPRPRVGIQVRASSVVRSYPHFHLETLIGRLLASGVEVYLFGLKGEVTVSPAPHMLNLAEMTPPLSFRQSVAAMVTCDAIVAPDSSLCHVAQALRVPTVALYSPFPAELRVSHSAWLTVLEGKGNCAPCFHLDRRSQSFPAGKACAQVGFCTVLAQIDPADITNALQRFIA